MSRARVGLAAVVMAVGLGLAACSVGGADGAGVTFATPLAEAPQSAAAGLPGVAPESH